MNTRLHRFVSLSAAVVALSTTFLAAAVPARAIPADGEPIRPAGKPDLVMTAGSMGYMWVPSSGYGYWDFAVTATVKNYGNAYASPSWAGVEIGTMDSQGIYRGYFCYLAIPTLAPGASYRAVVPFSGQGCMVWFNGAADYCRTVWESNETNNGLTYYAICDPNLIYL